MVTAVDHWRNGPNNIVTRKQRRTIKSPEIVLLTQKLVDGQRHAISRRGTSSLGWSAICQDQLMTRSGVDPRV